MGRILTELAQLAVPYFYQIIELRIVGVGEFGIGSEKLIKYIPVRFIVLSVAC
jgi:hypothetical protein